MTKYLKRLLFWLFILLLVVFMGYLGVHTYTQANCSRAINFLVEKYEIEKKELKALSYQEYVYEDITICDSLWLKKCSDDENLIYTFEIETKDGDKITVKEFKDGTHEDNFEKGKIRQSYLDKLEKLNKNNQSNEDEKVEAT